MNDKEFLEACDLFQQFGKIKDIDFDSILWSYHLNKVNLDIRGFDFENGTVVLGEYIDFGCDCCGGYYEDTIYDLDDLRIMEILGEIIDLLDNTLKLETGI